MARTVLITGSSSGIGRATAEVFARAGWNVAATSRRGELTFPRMAGKVVTPRLDVTDEQTIGGAVEQVVAQFGAIDVLVNNAGYGLNGPLEGIAPEQLEHQFHTNVFGLAAVTRLVLPVLRERGGTIVNVSSIGGRLAFPFGCAYHATKFAVEGLSESLRFELLPFGIQVKLVEPGGTRTDFLSRSQQWASHPAYEGPLRRFQEMVRQLDDRLPGPEGVAKVIYRAATDGSSRLRYPAQPGPYLLLRGLLPDGLWQRLVGVALGMHAGSPRTVADQGR